MERLVIKTICGKTQTLGFLTYGSFECCTLELPWKDNKNSVSCIPAGRYKGRKIVSPSNGACIEIMDVVNRTYIQIHSANYVRQLLGCIAVGRTMQDIDNDGSLDVTSSRNTLDELLALLPEEFEIDIHRLY